MAPKKVNKAKLEVAARELEAQAALIAKLQKKAKANEKVVQQINVKMKQSDKKMKDLKASTPLMKPRMSEASIMAALRRGNHLRAAPAPVARARGTGARRTSAYEQEIMAAIERQKRMANRRPVIIDRRNTPIGYISPGVGPFTGIPPMSPATEKRMAMKAALDSMRRKGVNPREVGRRLAERRQMEALLANNAPPREPTPSYRWEFGW